MRSKKVRRARKKIVRKIILVIQMIVLLSIITGLGVVGYTFYSVSKIIPTETDIADYKPTQATKIYSMDGEMLANIYQENREFVSITVIPKDLQNAVVSIEDERFYSHIGVDVKGIGRAAYKNIKRGKLSEGASTITQQLSRNIYLTSERKISRKLQEIVLSLQLERKLSKEQILEMYINQMYYGSGSYGAQTAAKTYFGKDVKNLDLAECALLAGLLQRPSAYSPYENMEAARNRRDVVLNKMAELGYITDKERDEAKAKNIKLIGQGPRGLAKFKAPWFVTYVLKDLTDKYGEDMVYRGGLRVYTTLNYEMQKTAEKEVQNGISRAARRNVSQGALICIDPKNGYIKAMVGGANPNFTEDQFNRAVQAKRQPGSAFKAFVYTAAIDNGYEPDSRISNKPIRYQGKPWPNNYTRSQNAEYYTIRQAVAQSVNRCAVNMAKEIGTNEVIEYARLMGIRSPLESSLALALGASVVTPLELCSAYGVFAAGGTRCEPMAIIKITSVVGDKESAIIEDNRPERHLVLSEQTGMMMNQVLRSVVTGGTGRTASRIPNAHGKTGTTSDDRDAWWVGYTPELVCAVWAGNDDYSPMRNAFGGSVCAPIWVNFMKKALEVHEKEPLVEVAGPDIPAYASNPTRTRHTSNDDDTRHDEGPTVETIKMCAGSGMRATEKCPSTYLVPKNADIMKLPLCNLSHEGSNTRPSSPDASPSGDSAGSPNNIRPITAEPAPRPSPPPPPAPRYVEVDICVDTGLKSNIYCPETIKRRFLDKDAPKRTCSKHGPPP